MLKGLLDTLNSEEGQFALSMLAAAGPQAQPMSFGQRLAGVMQQQSARKQAEEDRALKRSLIDAQMQEVLAQADERKAKVLKEKQALAEAQRIREVIGNAFSPVSPSQALAVGGAGPTPEAAALVGQQKPVNYQALIAQGVPVELVKGLAESRNFGRDKVARTVEVMGPDGRPQTVQLDDFGNRVGGAMDKPFELRNVDTGGAIRLQNPFTGAIGGGVNKTMTPDAIASNQLGWANYGLSKERLDKEKPNLQVINDSERGILFADKNSGLVRPGLGMDGQPVPGENSVKRENASKRVVPIIDQAIGMLEKGGPTASLAGTAVDAAAGAFGFSTKGAQGAAQLKALEGQIMMAQPRMEGPQSDKDVLLYRQMAAQVGDSTLPAETRLAALRTVRQLHEKYSGIAPLKSSNRSLDDILKQYGAP